MYGMECGYWALVQSRPSAHRRSEAGAGDAYGLFGGIGQRPGVPEPEEDLAAGAAVEKKMAAAAAAAAMKDWGDTSPSSPQLLTVPAGRINTRPNGNRPFEEIAPFCVPANDLINPLPPSLFYGSGWYAHHPSGSGGDALITAAHYWHSALPTSKLRIPIQGYWCVLFEGAGGCCWGGEFG